MVEHLPFKQGVLGPIPRRLTILPLVVRRNFGLLLIDAREKPTL